MSWRHSYLATQFPRSTVTSQHSYLAAQLASRPTRRRAARPACRVTGGLAGATTEVEHIGAGLDAGRVEERALVAGDAIIERSARRAQ